MSYHRQLKPPDLEGILSQLKQSLDGWAGSNTLLMTEELQGLAVLQSEFVAEELRKGVPDELRDQIRSIAISPAFARSVATVSTCHKCRFTER